MKHLCALLLLLPGSLAAQSYQGRTTDKSSGKALSGIHISLLLRDSTVLVSGLSDTAGTYNLHDSSGNATLLRAEATGYSTVYHMLSASATSLQLRLEETPTHTLKEVNVLARKPILEFKADRTIFNVEQSISATGGDAVDAIRRAPGTQVNHNEIGLSGKSSVSVMINGRLQQMAGEDLMQLLHSISADNISKIEIITAPSSRYDAEGNSGIINIVLKKNKQQGFRGNASLSQEYNMGSYFPTGNLTVFYQRKQLNLSGTANGGIQGYPYRSYIDNYFPGQRWHQDIAYPYRNPYARFQLTGDYALTSRATIGFSASEAYSVLDNKEKINAVAYDGQDRVDSLVSTFGHTTDRFLGKLAVNTNYEYRFDSSGRKLNLDLDYYRQQGQRHRDVTLQSTDPAGAHTVEELSRSSGTPLTLIRSAKLDIVMPYPRITWNLGAKVAHSENELNNLYERKIGTVYLTDTLQSNRFQYKEMIQALYASANKSVGNFELMAGLRVEHTRGQGLLINTGQQIVRNYTNLFPSVSVQYHIREHHGINFSFSRRVNRPNYTFLNPFRFYYTPNTYMEGNPGLQPSFNYVTKLGYTYKSALNVSLFYNSISNYFDRIFTVDTASRTNVASRQNLGTKHIVALETELALQPAPFWELTGSINGGYIRFLPKPASGNAQYSGFNWWVNATSNFYCNPLKTLAVEISAFYYAPRQRDYVYWAEMKSLSLAIRYLLLRKTLTITVAAEDLFATSYWLQTNRQNNTTEYSYDGHAFRLSLSYRFGNRNIKGRQQRNVEEIQRAN